MKQIDGGVSMLSAVETSKCTQFVIIYIYLKLDNLNLDLTICI